MSAKSDETQSLRDRLLTVVCDVRGHQWAGARQYTAQHDGLLLCLRCGFEESGRPVRGRRPLVRLT